MLQPARTTLYLTFAGAAGALFDLDAFTFTFASGTEAESWTSQLGISNVAKAAASGGFTVGNVHNGDWTAYSGINTNGATRFNARVSSNGVGGTYSDPLRFADRHPARLGDRPGHRRLGDLHQREHQH